MTRTSAITTTMTKTKSLTLAGLAALAAMAIGTTGCGSSSTAAQPVPAPTAFLSYVQRQTDGGSPVLYTVDPKTGASTSVAISINPNASEVSSDAAADAVVYQYYSGSDREIYYMGKNNQEVQLTTLTNEYDPAISSDGKTIVFVNCASECTLYTMNADGSNQQAVFPMSGFYQGYPAFSPDGGTLSFYLHCDDCCDDCDSAISGDAKGPHVHGTSSMAYMRKRRGTPRGSQAPQLPAYADGWYTISLASPTPTLVYATESIWGPTRFTSDGTKLLISVALSEYWNIYSINLDGTGFAPLTASVDADDIGAVEYNGQIYFDRYDTANNVWDFYSMAPNGSAQTQFNASSPTSYEFFVDEDFWSW